MTARQLLVVADDFGLTEATSRAIIQTHREGVVTATSVLVNAPGLHASLRLLEEAPDLEVGLHGAIVGEDPPVCPAEEIPTLVDRRGRFAASWRALLPRLVAGRVDPADVGRELRAQLDVLDQAGRLVTHLNLHQHLQLWPTLQPVVLELCAAAGIGYVRTPTSGSRGPRGRAVRRLARRLSEQLRSEGIRTNDGFAGLDEAGRWDATRIREVLCSVGGAVVELNVHPGADVDGSRDRYRWGYQWGGERAALVAPEIVEAVRRSGFTLVGPSHAAVGVHDEG